MATRSPKNTSSTSASQQGIASAAESAEEQGTNEEHAQTGDNSTFLAFGKITGRDSNVYRVDSLTVAHAACAWAIRHGEDPRLRIALASYEGEHDMPTSWTCLRWKASGGYGLLGAGLGLANCRRERLWFSPHCLAGAPATEPG